LSGFIIIEDLRFDSGSDPAKDFEQGIKRKNMADRIRNR